MRKAVIDEFTRRGASECIDLLEFRHYEVFTGARAADVYLIGWEPPEDEF